MFEYRLIECNKTRASRGVDTAWRDRNTCFMLWHQATVRAFSRKPERNGCANYLSLLSFVFATRMEVSKAGGLHKFMNWNIPSPTVEVIVSVFPKRKSAMFDSYRWKQTYFYAGKAIEIQNALGADIIMVLTNAFLSQPMCLQVRTEHCVGRNNAKAAMDKQALWYCGRNVAQICAVRKTPD